MDYICPEIPQAFLGYGYKWEHFDPNFTCSKMCTQDFEYFRNSPDVLNSMSIIARC